jgi:hypothetical protein
LSRREDLDNFVVSCDPSKVDMIIQAMCVLHNVIRKCDGTFSRPHNDNVIIGNPMNVPQPRRLTPKYIREYLCKYFKERAPIPFQDRYCKD